MYLRSTAPGRTVCLRFFGPLPSAQAAGLPRSAQKPPASSTRRYGIEASWPLFSVLSVSLECDKEGGLVLNAKHGFVSKQNPQTSGFPVFFLVVCLKKQSKQGCLEKQKRQNPYCCWVANPQTGFPCKTSSNQGSRQKSHAWTKLCTVSPVAKGNPGPATRSSRDVSNIHSQPLGDRKVIASSGIGCLLPASLFA